MLLDDRDALMRPYSYEELSPCRYSRARSPPPFELRIGLHLQVVRADECDAIDTTEEVSQFPIPPVFMAEVSATRRTPDPDSTAILPGMTPQPSFLTQPPQRNLTTSRTPP